MTTEPANSSLNQHSPLIIGASLVTVVALGFLFNAIHAPASVQTSVLASAVGIPSATAYYWQARRRNNTEDAARIAQGELDRPIGLVVMMVTSVLAAAVYLVVYLVRNINQVIFRDYMGNLVGGPLVLVMCFTFLFVAPFGFFFASYASHYLGKHPYRWTAVAIGGAWVFQLVIDAPMLVSVSRDSARPAEWRHDFVVAVLLTRSAIYAFCLVGCLCGVWYGRRHHATFLSKKLARMQRNASRAAATQQQSTTLDQTSPTDLPAPKDTAPQQPSQVSGPDLLEQLKKLGDLRDAGVLTDEEFQAKKAQILARI